ncbi:MAG TPA: histidine phosphatase family protein [Burkholderiaceae bacterium]|jgi:broad specificity phosphatase PhoE|nr:histidine phosphatase family protein [Burkholderiaceae bacterium]
MRRRVLLAGLAVAWLPRVRAADDAAWSALRGGTAVLLLRHAATEPGIGDPPGFRIEDCATQRNLSAAGREQAQRLGQELAARGVRFDAVYSSRWCRCRDTARLAFPGLPVQSLPALDSFFDERERGPAQTAQLRAWLGRLPAGRNVSLVTHMVNIAALVGANLGMGDGAVLRRGSSGWELAGRIAFSAV